ncbi:group III truncated hemoglobin [Rhodopseudomonas parapalustris]
MSIAHSDIVTDEQIAHLVRTFYSRARSDEVIGPIFDRAVHDWDHHIAQISDFWSSMLLKTGRYGGRPMRPHLMLNLAPEHFDRWLKLFEATATELFAPELATEFIIRARRIADSFEMGIATKQGKVAGPRHSV